MEIKVKKETADGVVRLQVSGKLKEVIIAEDFMQPSAERVQLCFAGTHSSGIVELSVKELEDVYKNIKDYVHVVKRRKI